MRGHIASKTNREDRQGLLIAGQKNHEGTGLTTLTFAAPAEINGTPVNVGVVVQFGDDGRPRAVAVDTDGKRFEIKNEEVPTRIRGRADQGSGDGAAHSVTSSIVTILQTTEESNTLNAKFSEREADMPSNVDLVMGRKESDAVTREGKALIREAQARQKQIEAAETADKSIALQAWENISEETQKVFATKWGEALRSAKQAHDAVTGLGAAGIQVESIKNTAQEGGEQFSKRQEILARNDVEWMGDFTSIKDQLEAHRDEISGMNPVAEVTYAGEDKEQLVDLIMDQIPGLGGARMVRNGVSFEFDRNGAKYIVLHARSEELRAAALVAPIVAKRGKLIAGQKSHEGTNTTTLTYAAPAIINGTPVNVGLVIQITSNGRPRAVNVETESGGVFKKTKPLKDFVAALAKAK